MIQYQSKNSQRLDELETKAREFEVLENVDLQKLLQMMERKEKRIKELERVDLDQSLKIDALMKNAL